MHKKTNWLTILAIFLISCTIGFRTSYPTVKASNTNSFVIPKVISVSPPKGNLCLNIDLNTNKVAVSDSNDNKVNINIQKKDSIIYKYKTSIVEKPKYIFVKQLPPVKKPTSVVRRSFKLDTSVQL